MAKTELIGRMIGISRHRLAIDGEGVTTLVAFHGCPLRCKYCLNPQSLSKDTQCIERSVEELIDEVRIDQLYFLATGGGITFGGGEPLLNSAYIKEFCRQCPKEWRISIESSLNVPRKNVEDVLPFVKEWIIDIKDMNPEIYKAYSGISNERVIDNLKWIASEHPDLLASISIRLPHIPDYNTDDDRNKSQALLETLGYTNFDRFEYMIR
ncbi:MAG: radical SAM protein [Prevotella sp.]|nr:radical SAM protein [Prevotella sp.]